MAERTKSRVPPMFAGLPSWMQTSGAEKARAGNKGDKRALSGQAKLLLLINGLFAVGNALSGTFVNVYIWKVKNDFALIGWLAVAQQCTMALVFYLAGKWVKERNKMNALRAGVAVSALFYGLVLWLGPSAARWVWLLGAVQGVSTGLFWLAFNVVYFEVTDPENRDRFNGWTGLLGAAAGMAAPWIAGYVITRLGGTSGYRLIFTLSLAVFVFGVLVSFFLRKRVVPGHYSWTYGFRQLAGAGSPWRSIAPAMVAQGIREGVFGFLITLMVFIATSNELKVGIFSLITSAVSFLSFMAVGRWLKPTYRYAGMLIGAVAMIAVILPFFWKVHYGTLLLFGIGNSLFSPLYIIPITSSVFDIIGKDEESARHRVEYIVLRELGLNAGRLAGTLLFIGVVSFTTKPLVIHFLLLFVGSSPLFAWLLIRKWLNPVMAMRD